MGIPSFLLRHTLSSCPHLSEVKHTCLYPEPDWLCAHRATVALPWVGREPTLVSGESDTGMRITTTPRGCFTIVAGTKRREPGTCLQRLQSPLDHMHEVLSLERRSVPFFKRFAAPKGQSPQGAKKRQKCTNPKLASGDSRGYGHQSDKRVHTEMNAFRTPVPFNLLRKTQPAMGCSRFPPTHKRSNVGRHRCR